MLSYVDNQTFNNWPTGVDTNQLIPAGSTAQNAATLTQILANATSWVDQKCRQRIGATTDSEQRRVVPNRNGQLEVFTKNFPLIQLLSAQWMSPYRGSTWTQVDLDYVTPLERSVLIYDGGYRIWRSVGAPKLIVQIEYENGYAHTTLTGPVAGTSTVVEAGSGTITVASPIGVGTSSAGSEGWNLSSTLTILDGQYTEDVTVDSIDGSTLTLDQPLAYNHQTGVLVTAVPQVVREATLLVADWMVQNPRGDGSFQMPSTATSAEKSAGGGMQPRSLLEEAAKMLMPFTRVL